MSVQSKALIGFVTILVSIAAGAQAVASDADAVRSAIRKEIAAWSNYDAHQIASLYTSDATWQNPFGARVHSSAELEKVLTMLFQRPAYRAAKDTEEAKIIDLHFPSPTVAVVWSDESSKGQIDDETGRPMHPRHSYYLEVLVKRDEGWKISECMIMDLITNP
jgi:uncharacterized protein (TIGR02246 family)